MKMHAPAHSHFSTRTIRNRRRMAGSLTAGAQAITVPHSGQMPLVLPVRS